jgi:phosphatase NudJ
LPREPIPTHFFAVVAVRQGDRFLLVHECKHGQLWYLPAGRVEPGESLVAAAERETLEETGVPVRVEGVIRVEHTPMVNAARLRIVLLARPLDDTPPKIFADEESLGAAWIGRDELDYYPLRGEEVRDIIDYLLAGGPVYPVELIQREGLPFDVPGRSPR